MAIPRDLITTGSSTRAILEQLEQTELFAAKCLHIVCMSSESCDLCPAKEADCSRTGTRVKQVQNAVEQM